MRIGKVRKRDEGTEAEKEEEKKRKRRGEKGENFSVQTLYFAEKVCYNETDL